MKKGYLVFNENKECIGIFINSKEIVTVSFNKVIKVKANKVYNKNKKLGYLKKAKGYRLSRLIKYIENKVEKRNLLTSIIININSYECTQIIKQAAKEVEINLKNNLYNSKEIIKVD